MLLALTTFALHGGLTLAIGALAVRYLLVARTGMAEAERAAMLRRAAGLGAIGAACALVAAPTRAAMQVAALIEPGEPWTPMLRAVVQGSALGRALQLQAIWGAAATMAFSIARSGRERGWRAATVAIAVLAVTPGLSGHAAASATPTLALAMAYAHVMGAGLWIGTLTHLWRAGRSASDHALRESIAAFHPVAMTAAALVLVSGVRQAWDLATDPLGAIRTTWGVALVVKLALVAAVLALGYRHWRHGETRILRGERPALQRSLGAETALAAIVLIVTAILTTTTPPE